MPASAYPVPSFVDYVNAENSQSLNALAFCNNDLAWMFKRYLLQKAISVFKWTLPERWNKNYFLYVLYCFGHLAVVNTDKFGVIPQACGLRGYDVFYQPTNAIITNALLTGILEPRINRECTLFQLEPDYGGIMDLVTYYANLMAQAAEAGAINLNNSKVSYAFFAANKKAAETYKKAFDAVSNGQPMVVMDKDLLSPDGTPTWTTFTHDVKANYILTDLLADMRKIETKFCTDIGIPNANTDKRERLISSEVDANNVETETMVEGWLERLKDSCEKSRAMFGIDISVDWRNPPEPTQPAEQTGGVEDVAD